MSDYELGIINACSLVFPYVALSGCFFHLWQTLYRNIQERGLASAYNDPTDRSVKKFTHMIAALAFVPISDVECYFNAVKNEAPEELEDFVEYFERTYVLGKLKVGRRKAVAPRYKIQFWNHPDAAKTGESKTNNVSEGWHNRFRFLMGKNHPDIYSFIKEIQKEQGDTEISVVELSLGRKIKAAPKKRWLDVQKRLQNIVLNYESYEILAYLEAIGDTMST